MCKVKHKGKGRHYQNKDPHEAAVRHCPILVMPSLTCFTQCEEQPCFLRFMFFPVIPSGDASIMGEKLMLSFTSSQKQNAHRSRTFHFCGFYGLCSFITRKQCFTLITCECDANVDTGLCYNDL